MSKNNFLLVDLNESKTKKIAETITSDTSRKILNYLTEKEDAEANIAKELNIPISTVHYHLQKLMEAKLVIADEFHYSQKGREINHYKLANKYIIIAPKNISGLREKLKGILPVAIAALGISAVIKLVQTYSVPLFTAKSDALMQATPMMDEAVEEVMLAAPRVAEQTAPIISQQPDIAFWFLAGNFATIAIYLVYNIVKEYIKEKKSI